MRWAAAHLGGQLIFGLAQVDDMPEQAVWRQFDIADLDDHIGLHPMDPAKHQRRTETATAWGRYRDRHLFDRQGPKALPEPLQPGLGQVGPGSACIDELALWCVVAEQQRPDPMSTALGIAPSDDDKFLPVEALDLEPCTPVGLIPAIGALRHDALKTAFAG